MRNNLPILLCFGTRPEWLKIKPLIKIMNRGDYKLLFTGQHVDLLSDTEVDYQININHSDNRLDSIISDCILQFPNDEFRGVLVQGDTGSAFGCALAAFNRKLKIYYLEAGLRSYNLEHPYPEEGYRQMISRISDVNFTPTELSAQNLKDEMVSGKIHIVGNSVLDNLVHYKNGEYGDSILVTMHRRENHHIMKDWFTVLNQLAMEYNELKFILPLHPNPDVQKHRDILTHVNVVKPMGHDELINVLRMSKFVITDSGGLQEEGSFFNKKVIVCRETTERPEGLESGHLYLCETPNELKKLFGDIYKSPYINSKCPYGDGKTAERLYSILMNE